MPRTHPHCIATEHGHRLCLTLEVAMPRTHPRCLAAKRHPSLCLPRRRRYRARLVVLPLRRLLPAVPLVAQRGMRRCTGTWPRHCSSAALTTPPRC